MTATQSNDQDLVILVDEHDQPIGQAKKLEAHQKNWLHRAFSIFIFKRESHPDSKLTREPKLLLQQRAGHKYHSPLLWTNTCCSHPRPNEMTITAAQRRLKEELGFSLPLTHVGHFIYNAHFSNGLSEHELDHVLIGTIDPAHHIIPNSDEVAAIRWVTIEELKIDYHLHPHRYTPWLMQALTLAEKGS
jgi:isopentenyl-diphosphate delta-isomerase